MTNNGDQKNRFEFRPLLRPLFVVAAQVTAQACLMGLAEEVVRTGSFQRGRHRTRRIFFVPWLILRHYFHPIRVYPEPAVLQRPHSSPQAGRCCSPFNNSARKRLCYESRSRGERYGTMLVQLIAGRGAPEKCTNCKTVRKSAFHSSREDELPHI